MTDRELLEAAARAAGVVGEYVEKIRVTTDVGREVFTGIRTGPETCWNPLTDDGDALRLAVALRLCFGPNFDGDTAVAFGNDGRNITEPYDADPYAATRRAIVRAAAAMAAQPEAPQAP